MKLKCHTGRLSPDHTYGSKAIVSHYTLSRRVQFISAVPNVENPEQQYRECLTGSVSLFRTNSENTEISVASGNWPCESWVNAIDFFLFSQLRENNEMSSDEIKPRFHVKGNKQFTEDIKLHEWAGQTRHRPYSILQYQRRRHWNYRIVHKIGPPGHTVSPAIHMCAPCHLPSMACLFLLSFRKAVLLQFHPVIPFLRHWSSLHTLVYSG